MTGKRKAWNSTLGVGKGFGQRQKPLQSSTPLPRGDKPLARNKEMPRAGAPKRATMAAKPRRDTNPRKTVTDVVKDRARRMVGELPDGTPMCEVCGRKPGRQKQHREARGMGGSPRPEINQPANLLLVCGDFGSWTGCHHRMEHVDRVEAKDNGWSLPFGSDATAHPVLLADGNRYLLTNDGDAIPAPSTEGATAA